MATVPASNEQGFYSGPMSEQERVDVRRYCWYPAYGPGASGFQGWRFFQAYGALEYRLTNMAASEFSVIRLMLSTLATLEAAIPAASGGLNVAEASVFVRNPRELMERRQLYDYHRKELCDFLGIPPGPNNRSSASGNIVV